MKLCPERKCPHYWEATKYPRKCYYEPMCWKGYLDILISLTKMRLRKAKGTDQDILKEKKVIK